MRDPNRASVYKRCMRRPHKALIEVEWTPDLVGALADASAAIGALDARVSNSLLTVVWQNRVKLTGYAAALRLQHEPLEEVDVFSHFCSLRLPGRAIAETNSEPYAEFAEWEAMLRDGEGRHWREALPFTFELPSCWEDAPKLVRALTVLEAWVRADPTKLAWLQGPLLLHQFGVTDAILPNMVVGDAAMRSDGAGGDVMLRSLLRKLRDAAEIGLARFGAMEEALVRFAGVLAEEKRPGRLQDLGMLLLVEPLLTPREVADRLGLTLSGAGKLLQRAAAQDIVCEISGRGTWRAYATRDIALALNLVEPRRGRPRKFPPPREDLRKLVDALP